MDLFRELCVALHAWRRLFHRLRGGMSSTTKLRRSPNDDTWRLR